MTVYHSSSVVVDKPNHQICLASQRLIDGYLTYVSTEEL